MSNVFNRFDDKVITAGLLRLIAEPSNYKNFKKFLIKEYFYQGDSSPHAEATRELISVMNLMTKDTNGMNMNILSVKGEISARIENDAKRENTLSHYEKWIGNAEINELASNDGVFETFMNYLKVLQIAKLSTEMIGDFNQFNIDSAIGKMSSTLTNINSIDVGADVKELEYSKMFDLARRSSTGSDNKVLYLGCDPLDEDVGGFNTKTLTLFLALTGNGKTTMCHHLIKRCIQTKTKAMVWCVEDGEESFSAKFLSAYTGIAKKRIEGSKGAQSDLSPEEIVLIQNAMADIQKYIRVFYVWGKSIEYIHEKSAEIEKLEKLDGKPGGYPVHIVDYTGHIFDKTGNKNEENYVKIAQAYKERRDYAGKYNKICFDFMQVNRGGAQKQLGTATKQVLTLSDIARGFDLTHPCDNIISINRDEKQKRDRKASLHICKCRDGVVGSTYIIDTKFESSSYDMSNPEKDVSI